jgi:hypothetical protein
VSAPNVHGRAKQLFTDRAEQGAIEALQLWCVGWERRRLVCLQQGVTEIHF